ncbi:MAG: glycosyltransferase family 39 protein [bacterium]
MKHSETTAMNVSSTERRIKTAAVWLFLMTSAIFAFTASGRFSVIDENSRFMLTANIVDKHTITVPNGSIPGRGGKTFSKYGPAGSALAIPLYAVSRIVEKVSGISMSGGFITSFFNSAVSGAEIALFFLALVRFGLAPAGALLAALLMAFASPVWPYSRTFFAEPLSGFAFVGVMFCLVTPTEKWTSRLSLAAGAFFTLGFLSRFETVFLGPVFLALLLFRHRGAFVRNTVLFGIAPFLGCVLLGVYNYYRFGNPLSFGYNETFSTALFTGFIGLLVSPGKGIVFFFPLFVAAVAAWALFYRRNMWLMASAALVPGALLLIVSRWNLWGGDLSWGPRYLIPTIPWMFLPIALLIGDIVAKRARPAAGGALIFIAVVSVLVQLIGMSVNFKDVAVTIYTTPGNSTGSMASDHFQAKLSPIRAHVEAIEMMLNGRNPVSMNPSGDPARYKKIQSFLKPNYWIYAKWRESAGQGKRRAAYAAMALCFLAVFAFAGTRLLRIWPELASDSATRTT